LRLDQVTRPGRYPTEVTPQPFRLPGQAQPVG